MSLPLRLADAVDRVSIQVGRLAAWLGLAMVLTGAWYAVGRAVEERFDVRLTSSSLTEAQWYLFSVLFLFAAPWALQSGAHVRVDVLHARLHPRQRAWVELLGMLLFLVPFCGFAIATSLPVGLESLRQLEGSPDPGGLARWPLKLAVPIAFGLLLLQGLAEAIRALAELRGLEPGGRRGAESERPEAHA